jgi:hypothetical protein
MCLSIPESRRRKVLTNRWLNESGRVAHPNSPAGLGGPGAFRSPGLFGAYASDGQLPDGEAPVSRTVDPSLVALAEGEVAKEAVRQPAPKVAKDAADEIAQKVFTLKLKADKSGVPDLEGAITDFTSIAKGKVSHTTNPAGDKVATMSNTATWVITIQTQYGTGKADEDSSYGRGRTDPDKAAGNVTLGFHESCHREALLDYFRNTAAPTFTGAVGDAVTDFNDKVTAYTDAMEAYFVKARTTNEAAVDEVGKPTKSEYLADPEGTADD